MLENKPGSENQIRVLVTMSGGVDSSVAAALLKEQGYAVTGVIMRIWAGDSAAAAGSPGLHHGCYGPGENEDIEDAREVARTLGIPFQVLDLTREYQTTVLDYFCGEYLSGRTPNPCIRCNQRIKFQALIEKARASGLKFDLIASGHYARVVYDVITGRYLLKKARDLAKDQSYFLSFLSQEQLGSLRFPLGDYTKAEVRKMAARYGLQVADKPDSQNFIAGDYSSVIKAGSTPGSILDKQGNVLGRHQGLQFYTVGQRKGLEIVAPGPWYVTALDPGQNSLTVGGRQDIYQSEFGVSNINWITVAEPGQPFLAEVKIRSSHQAAEALITPIEKTSARVKFSTPQMAITPGQVAVFYHEEFVLGGGIIRENQASS